MKSKNLLLIALLVLTIGLGLSACKNETDEDAAKAPDTKQDDQKVDTSKLSAECNIGQANPSAHMPVGYDKEKNQAILPTGHIVTPEGMTIETLRFVWGLKFAPDGKTIYTLAGNGPQGLQVFEIAGEKMVLKQTITSVEGKRLSVGYGIAVTNDGNTVYMAGGGNEDVVVFDASGDKLVFKKRISLIGYIGGIKLSDDESYLFALASTRSELYKVDLKDDSYKTLKVGNYPYDVVITKDMSKAYTSNWGGWSVTSVNVKDWKVIKEIDCEKAPEGLAFNADEKKLFVTNADSDSISVVDTAQDTLVDTIKLDPENFELKAWTPNAITVTGGRAYVASADHNAVEVIDTKTNKIIGMIPTAWYPVWIDASPDGKTLAIANAKGFGTKPGDGVKAVHTGQGVIGVLQVLDIPDDTKLTALTTTVKENTNRPLNFYPDNNCKKKLPLPVDKNEKSVIEHVILVIKENKTYDEYLGQLAGETGDKWHDPELAMFGEYKDAEGNTIHNSPNHTELAKTWVDFVNFYSDSEVSVQGHLWTTAADCTDFVEKTRFDRTPASGADPNTVHYNRSIFYHLYDNNVNFRVYGEATGFTLKELELMKDKIDMKYPYWSMGATDVDKAKEIIREWELAEKTGEESLFPPFIYIVLPNDHTHGGKAGMPSPRSMVADNDHGMGMLVEWLSNSSFWDKSVMFVIEDDPQGGMGDHIDAHRSICFAASPWVKRGYMSEVHYSMPSLYRTIEIILGVPPMTKNTLLAQPMVDIFTDQPNSDKYKAIVPKVPLTFNPETGRFAEEAKKWDWSHYDGHEGLGDHVYRMLNGDKPRPPQAKFIDE